MYVHREKKMFEPFSVSEQLTDMHDAVVETVTVQLQARHRDARRLTESTRKTIATKTTIVLQNQSQ